MRLVIVPLLAARAALASPEGAEARSKKEALIAEKTARRDVRREEAPPVGAAGGTPISIVNTWTNEVLPVDPGAAPPRGAVDRLLRCHYTNQQAPMDPRPFQVALDAAARFRVRVIEVISGYRAPKYNLMLRKKGHEVGRDSQHPLGHAVDFRLPGLPTKKLLAFVRSLRLGGVGYYPRSGFVHADVGRVRFWRGH